GNDLGAILGVDTFTYNDNNEVPYTYTARDSFSVRNDADGTISYYHLFDNKEKTLEHKAGDTATHQVRYIKDSSKTAYDWVINGIDVETNQVIFTDSKNIVPGANEDYKAKTEVTFDDNDYILDTNAANVYYHTYDVNGERTTYIPYHKVDAKTKTSYDIKVQYVDVKTLEVIESKTVKATAKDNGVMITSPDKIKEGKDSYVRIQGEVDEKQHEFYMPQRTYSIFYRDVNDIQSASITKNVVYDETVYTEKTVEQPVDVIATETETVEGGPSTAAATSDQNPEVSAPDSLLVNGKTGETVLVDEKGAEKAKSVQNLKDGEVPLGKGSGDQDNSAKAQVAAVTSSLPFIVGVSLAGLAILFLIILFFYKKRKNGNIGTNDK
ncbi:MAG TPA: hypothetical protein H9887_00710, partial [Candidatus Dorea intestinavium]|nr:hypothetical protein [Candidatus Dorea intestinavium]